MPVRALLLTLLSAGLVEDDGVWRRGKIEVLLKSGTLWDVIPAPTHLAQAKAFLAQVQRDNDTLSLTEFLAKYGLRPWDGRSALERLTQS